MFNIFKFIFELLDKTYNANAGHAAAAAADHSVGAHAGGAAAAGEIWLLRRRRRKCGRHTRLFWTPFKTESVKLEGEDYPTMPLACLAISSLRRHCQKPLQVLLYK